MWKLTFAQNLPKLYTITQQNREKSHQKALLFCFLSCMIGISGKTATDKLKKPVA
jgi:hypothetical protein